MLSKGLWAFQYVFGKPIQNQSFQETEFLDQPPMVLLAGLERTQCRQQAKCDLLVLTRAGCFPELLFNLSSLYGEGETESASAQQNGVHNGSSPKSLSNLTGHGPILLPATYTCVKERLYQELNRPTSRKRFISLSNSQLVLTIIIHRLTIA